MAGALLIEVDADKALARRFRHQADSEYGLSALVQHFHSPVGVLLQAAGNAAEKVCTHLVSFRPRRPRGSQMESLDRMRRNSGHDLSGKNIAALSNPAIFPHGCQAAPTADLTATGWIDSRYQDVKMSPRRTTARRASPGLFRSALIEKVALGY